MTEENQPAELPDYLRDSSEDADKTLDEEVDAAKAWAEAFAESGEDSDIDPEADPQTEPIAEQPVSDPVEDSEPEGQSTTVGSDNDENLVTPQAPVTEGDAPAPEPEPEPDSMSDTSTQAWSSFLNEETMAETKDSPTDVVDSDVPDTAPAQPTEELETTVVRRKSLLGTEPEAAPGAGAAPTDAANETPEEVDPQWQPRQPELLGNEDKKLNESTMLAGASIKPAKISRAGAHAWSLLLSLIGVPLAWAFLRHAGGLLYGSNHSAWDTGKYSVEGLVFLILGLVAVIVIGSFVRLSSLGMFVSGILFTVLGGAFVVVPGAMKSAVGTSLQGMQDSPVMALKVLGYLIESAGASGQFLVIGILLIMIGVVGHSARRKGRVDQIADKALARAENA